ncbi:hypothetical protein LDENG_00136620 [Lucifuga dentata]|nr:hypothetical protein LDENG_00136620 [Lucifuga dentata]
MSSLNAAACEGFYSKLIDEEENRNSDAGFSGKIHKDLNSEELTPPAGRPGPYRLATICLAALCGVLLIALIGVTAHYKNRPQAGGEDVSEIQIQKQTQEVNVSVLDAAIRKLQQEKAELQSERDQLLLRLNAKPTTKAADGVGATTAATAATIVCPTDWLLFNSSCYFVSRISRDWPESQSFCQSKGAHLAVIHTVEEQTFLWNLLPRGHWNAFWFGITDEHTEDHWKWVDGTPLVGGFWEVGEPNNHIDEDCGYMVKTQVLERVAARSWYDAPCSMYWRFICEKEMRPGASTAIPH